MKKKDELTYKPIIKLVGSDGNAYSIIGKARRALLDAGLKDEAERYMAEATKGDYQNLLKVTMDYCEVE